LVFLMILLDIPEDIPFPGRTKNVFVSIRLK
jgi:hypothetical protein